MIHIRCISTQRNNKNNLRPKTIDNNQSSINVPLPNKNIHKQYYAFHFSYYKAKILPKKIIKKNVDLLLNIVLECKKISYTYWLFDDQTEKREHVRYLRDRAGNAYYFLQKNIADFKKT